MSAFYLGSGAFADWTAPAEIEYLIDIIAAMVRERDTINHQIAAATKRLAELRDQERK